MTNAQSIARKLRVEGCEFVPQGAISESDAQQGLTDAVSHELNKLWREDDPPSEKLLTQHREHR